MKKRVFSRRRFLWQTLRDDGLKEFIRYLRIEWPRLCNRQPAIDGYVTARNGHQYRSDPDWEVEVDE